ncbi:hypothetical protein LWC33_23760 [Pseudonocardia sp. RS11V-5]|uniref:hypothetical protein n=1 Tax=Pseudonocardia terrae TaxID=2905831 RepID=UPI001E2E2706|nr:hypothetical protein [Pseudonocardia terrae]MCE3554460.1 hypothetical protein [Pseudonocardia terrae]
MEVQRPVTIDPLRRDHGMRSERGRGAHHRPRQTRTSATYPWQVGVAAVLWLVLGAVLIGAGTGITSSSADPEQVDKIVGTLGSDTVAGTAQHGPGILWVGLGLAILVLGALLGIGQGWTRYVLMGLGVGAVVALALAGAWEVLVAMAVLVVASVLLLAPRVHRYLG